MSMRATAGLQDFFKKQTMPTTIGLISGVVGVAVLLFLTRISPEPLVVIGSSLSKPWAFLTYPFAEPLAGGGMGVISLLFLSFWLYWVGGSLEQDLGSLKLALIWVIASVICALFVIFGASVVHTQAFAYGPILPVSFITVMWGIRNKTALIRLMMVIPINGFFLALITIAVVFVEYGQANLILGVFACLPMGLAWLYAENKLPGLTYGKRVVSVAYKPSKERIAKENAYFDDVRKREKERNERERLRKLFEDSLDDDAR